MSADCSIIIPAYNSEKTIVGTLDSIELNKSWKYQVEVIVVDDGSDDKTYSIASDYAKEYTEIIVLTQDNTGVSSARNKGIRNASGKYIFFMDADDTVCRETLELMISISEEQSLPLVLANYNEYDTMKNKITRRYCGIRTNIVLDKAYINNNIFLRYFIGDICGLSCLWNKLFLRERINECNLYFDENRTHGEDWDFCIRYFESIDSFIALPEVVYNYRISGGFNSNKYGKPTLQGFVKSYQMQQRLKETHGFCEKESNEYITFLGRYANLIVSFLKNEEIETKEKKAFLKNEDVKCVIRSVRKFNINELTIIQQSRRYKLALQLISIGLFRIGISMIK